MTFIETRSKEWPLRPRWRRDKDRVDERDARARFHRHEWMGLRRLEERFLRGSAAEQVARILCGAIHRPRGKWDVLQAAIFLHVEALEGANPARFCLRCEGPPVRHPQQKTARCG